MGSPRLQGTLPVVDGFEEKFHFGFVDEAWGLGGGGGGGEG